MFNYSLKRVIQVCSRNVRSESIKNKIKTCEILELLILWPAPTICITLDLKALDALNIVIFENVCLFIKMKDEK